MRPAQLRRFALISAEHRMRILFSFNEAGAAAPVCRAKSTRIFRLFRRFNEAGAAAPVCQTFFRLLQKEIFQLQ